MVQGVGSRGRNLPEVEKFVTGLIWFPNKCLADHHSRSAFTMAIQVYYHQSTKEIKKANGHGKNIKELIK